MASRTYTAKQIGSMVGLTKRQIHRLRKKHFPHAKLREIGGVKYYEYPLSDVREFLIKRGKSLDILEVSEDG
jgi:hypothetical protein